MMSLVAGKSAMKYLVSAGLSLTLAGCVRMGSVVLDTSNQLCATVASGSGSNDYIFVDTALCATPDQAISHFMIPECFSYTFTDANNDGIKDLKLRKQVLAPLVRSCENPEGTSAGYYLIDQTGNIQQP